LCDRHSRLELFVLITVVVTLVISSAGKAQGLSGIPMIVSGSVMLNGGPAPDGLNLTSWDRGQLVGSTTTSGGDYSVQVCGQAGQACNQGDTISFQLDQLRTNQTTVFNAGSPVNLDLGFTGSPTTMSTPEFPSFAVTPLVILLITLGAVASQRTKSKTKESKEPFTGSLFCLNS